MSGWLRNTLMPGLPMGQRASHAVDAPGDYASSKRRFRQGVGSPDDDIIAYS